MKRILVSRPDRIGDVVLSTPVLAALKERFPGIRITVLVRSLVEPLLRGHPDIDELLIFDPEGKHSGMSGAFALARELRERKFEAAVALQSHSGIAMAMALARIPVRVGPLSKPHSYVFYNLGVRQRRSQVEMHEADYNLALLKPFGIEAGGKKRFPTRIQFSRDSSERARSWLQSAGLKGSGKLIAIHPGMGGSALNWPEENYAELGKRLLAQGHEVVLTGGSGERDLLDRMRSKLGEGAKYFVSTGGVDQLAGIFSQADLVVAPSTGPLHIAVALGKKVLSFYPSIPVQSPRRWGPYALESGQARVLVAEDNNMAKLTVDQALSEATQLLATLEKR